MICQKEINITSWIQFRAHEISHPKKNQSIEHIIQNINSEQYQNIATKLKNSEYFKNSNKFNYVKSKFYMKLSTNYLITMQYNKIDPTKLFDFTKIIRKYLPKTNETTIQNIIQNYSNFVKQNASMKQYFYHSLLKDFFENCKDQKELKDEKENDIEANKVHTNNQPKLKKKKIVFKIFIHRFCINVGKH